MRSPEWLASGTRLVTRILIRRRLKCQQAGTHEVRWPSACPACGVAS